MGLLDQVMNSVTGGPAARKPGLGGTIAAGVVLALAVKAVRSFEARRAAEAAGGQPAGADSQAGGLLGGLGGMLGGLGGAGALGALVAQLQQNGLGQQVNSWIGHGKNQPVAPHELADALGDETLRRLQDQTGMPRDQLLRDLAQNLPDAVHELTPEGREPNDAELQKIATKPTGV
jgi:uncharacterized protein YidB (DUF937 family)